MEELMQSGQIQFCMRLIIFKALVVQKKQILYNAPLWQRYR